MLLQIDTREKKKQQDLVKAEFADTNVKVAVVPLSVCDYIVRDDNDTILFGVEWKNYNDFITSMTSGHLTSQLIDMEGFEHPYLFIVGNYRSWVAVNDYSMVTRQMIAGYITSIISRYKTKVFFYESVPEGVRELKHLVKIHTEDTDMSHTQYKLPERKVHTGNPQRDMFMSLPSVGDKRCREYMSHITFMDFLSTCKYDDEAKKTLKNKHSINVSESLIEFCKQL